MQWTNLQSWTTVETSAPDSPTSKLMEALDYARDLDDQKLRSLILDVSRESFLRGWVIGLARREP